MKASKTVVAATLAGSLMLLATAALHASGYSWIAESIQESDLSDFLKSILPSLFLYPSILMIVLAVAATLALRWPAVATGVWGVVCVIVALNSLLGFILGGPVPGLVLLVAAGLFGFAAYRQAMKRV
ncbi:MAG: hypothetical protein AAGL69_07360 [Pseudomonadota bacterium]